LPCPGVTSSFWPSSQLRRKISSGLRLFPNLRRFSFPSFFQRDRLLLSTFTIRRRPRSPVNSFPSPNLFPRFKRLPLPFPRPVRISDCFNLRSGLFRFFKSSAQFCFVSVRSFFSPPRSLPSSFPLVSHPGLLFSFFLFMRLIWRISVLSISDLKLFTHL